MAQLLVFQIFADGYLIVAGIFLSIRLSIC